MIYDENNFIYIEKYVGRRVAMSRFLISFFGFPRSFFKLIVEELSMTFSMLTLSVRMHAQQFRLAIKGKVLHPVTLEEYQSIQSEKNHDK